MCFQIGQYSEQWRCTESAPRSALKVSGSFMLFFPHTVRFRRGSVSLVVSLPKPRVPLRDSALAHQPHFLRVLLCEEAAVGVSQNEVVAFMVLCHAPAKWAG